MDAARARRPTAIVSAVTVGACVLPVSALGAWVSDRECNHLEGDVEVAEPGTPRGSWCSAVQPGHSWVPLLLVPVLLAVVLMLALSRWRSHLLSSLVWLLVCALVLAQMYHLESLRAYLEI